MLHWLIPLAGTLIVAAFPLVSHLRLVAREARAEQRLSELWGAQEGFRGAGGGGGFATAMASLTTPCPPAVSGIAGPGTSGPGPPGPGSDGVTGYVMTLRAARDSQPMALDCHGRPTSSDYYAAATPGPSAGRRAFAMTSNGRVFLFFDGIAPTEADMAPGGLATPRETLDTLKIP